MRSIVLLAVWLLIAAPAAAQEGPAPEPITLAEVLASGRAGSPAIAAARSRERAAAAAADRAGRWANPSLEFQSENWGAPPPGLRRDTFVTVSQRLELGGKRGARRGAALADAEAARADAFATMRAAEGELAARFLDAVRLRDRVRILSEQRDALDELVRVLERRVAEGFAPDADRARLAAERAAVAIAVTRAEGAADRAFLDLQALAACRTGAPRRRSSGPGPSRCRPVTRRRSRPAPRPRGPMSAPRPRGLGPRTARSAWKTPCGSLT